jgi:hypothetical protein
MTTFTLATGRYKGHRRADGVAIITSVGKPRWMTGSPILNDVAPYGIFNVKPALPWPEFTRRYLTRLDERADQITDQLAAIAAAHPGERLVVCCWCDIQTEDHTAGGECHRRLFAHWWHTRTGVYVPDISVAHARGPAAGTPPALTLF